MVAIPFPAGSSNAGNKQESGGRLVNAMVEPLAGAAKGSVVIKRTPGLRTVATHSTAVHCRGIWPIGNTAMVVMNDRCNQFSGSALTDIGTLSGDQPVTMASNNRTPTADTVCVTENGAFILSTGAAPVPYPDADVGSPNSVCFGDSYFFFTYGNGICRSSGINSTAINVNDYIQCEARADGLLRGVFYRQELFLMGQSSIEVWQNTGNATGFPFTRATVIPRGLIGQWAVAGWEPGFANALMWVGDDNIVYKLNGYTPERVSSHDVERLIAAENTKSNLRACCYMSEGHAIWSIKGTSFCWEYDLTTGQWHERNSHESATWIGEASAQLNNVWYVGSASTGEIYQVDASYYKEGGDPVIWQVQSGRVAEFPAEIQVSLVALNFDMGTGIDTGTAPIETDPMVRISWSDNGGYSFGQSLARSLGRQAQTGNRVTVNRCGQTKPQGRVWKLEVSDPVYVGLVSGTMEAEARK